MANIIEYLFKNSDLDKTDIKLLSAIREDARMPLKEIATRCRVSKQTVLYRINKLLRTGIIKGFRTNIDYPRIGYTIYYVFIQTRFIDDEAAFIKELSQLKGCSIIMKSITQYSYNLKIITKNISQTILELEGFFSRKKNISSHFILQRLGSIKEQVEIDDKDKRILEELQGDCRQSALEIAKKVNLSYDTVHKRIKRLIKEKVIKNFLTVINFNVEGFNYYSVLLKFADDQLDSQNTFNMMLKGDPQVVRRFKCIGEFGYMFEIVDNNYISINEKINKIRSRFHSMIRYSQIVPIQDHYFFTVRLD